MWDLRTPEYPVLNLSGKCLLTLDIHSHGILSTSWCPHDPRIVSSSSRDGRTVFFESESGRVISEFSDNRKYQSLNWSPNIPGKLIGFDED